MPNRSILRLTSHHFYLLLCLIQRGFFGAALLIGLVSIIGCDSEEPELELAPATPKNLKAEQVENGIQLSWNVVIDTNTNSIPDLYRVYRLDADQQDEKQITRTEQLQFVDTEVNKNRSYTYTVSGIKQTDDGEVESSRSGSVEVTFAVSVPQISVDLIDFGETETSQILTVRNTGLAPLSWSATVDMEWLTIEPNRGTIEARSEQQITLTASRKYDPGRLGAILTFQAEPEFEQKVNLQLTISAEPRLSIAPNAIDFGLDWQYQMMKVQNTGSGTLLWQAEKVKRSDWLKMSPMEGSVAAGEADPVKLEIVDNELVDFPAGFQISETVLIRSIVDQHKNAPDGDQPSTLRSLFATVKIPKPILHLSTTEVDFGEQQDRLPLVIDNVGTGQFGWRISGGSDWLHYTPSTGLTSIDLDRVELVIDRHLLIIQDYKTEIVVQSQGPAGYAEEMAVKVQMRVGERPEISTSKNDFDFGQKLQLQTLDLKNSGTGVLRWQIKQDEKWLMIAPTTGIIRTETVPISLSVNRADLPAGEYATQFTITAKKTESRSITVKMQVPKSKLELSTTTIGFGTGFGSDLQQQSQQLQVRNRGQAILNWNLESKTEWIGVRSRHPSPDDQPFRLTGTLKADTQQEIEIFLKQLEKLPAGEHNGHLQVTDGERIQQIRVQITKTGRISGIVLDHQTRRPLSNATIDLTKTNSNTGDATQTDAQGRFLLPFEQEGHYQITANARSYLPRVESFPTQRGQAMVEVRLSPLLNRATTVINGLHSPRQLVVDSKGHLYISNEINDTVTVLEDLLPPKEIPLSQPFSGRPLGLAFWKDRLFVALSAFDRIAVIDTKTRQEVHRFVVGDFPGDCKIAGDRMFVTLQREDKIAVVDLTIPARRNRISVSRQPGQMVVDQKYLYVCNMGDDTVSVVDLQTERELYRIRVGQRPTEIRLGAVLSNGRQYLYVLNSLSSDVSMIQISNHLEIQRLKTGFRPVAIAVHPLLEGREVVYVIEQRGKMTAIEMPRRTVVTDIGLTISPKATTSIFDPTTSRFYVLHTTGQRLTVLEPPK